MATRQPSPVGLDEAFADALAPLAKFNALLADMETGVVIDPQDIGVIGQALMRLALRDLGSLAAIVARDCGPIRVGRKQRDSDAGIEDFEYTRVKKETCARGAAA
jgi:hypothetical protein